MCVASQLFVSVESPATEYFSYTFELEISITDMRLPASVPYTCQVD